MPYSETGSEFLTFENPPLTNNEYNSRPKPTNSNQEYYIIDGQLVNKKMYKDYAKMYNAAEKDGVILNITNGFRSPEKEIPAGKQPGIVNRIPSQLLLRNNLISSSIEKDGIKYECTNKEELKEQTEITTAIYKALNSTQTFEVDTSTISPQSTWFENLVAPPGTSIHGVGLGLDLNTGRRSKGTLNDKIYTWLVLNSWRYGFVRTIYSEEWHFEYLRIDPKTFKVKPKATDHTSGGPYSELTGITEKTKYPDNLYFKDLFLNDLVYNPETNEYISQRKIPMESITPISPSLTPTIPLDNGLQGIQPVNAPSIPFETRQ
jgi:LAS superfamily LD-carboxypeptidase LdcB